MNCTLSFLIFWDHLIWASLPFTGEAGVTSQNSNMYTARPSEIVLHLFLNVLQSFHQLFWVFLFIQLLDPFSALTLCKKPQLQHAPSQQGFRGAQREISLSRSVYVHLQARARLNWFIDASISPSVWQRGSWYPNGGKRLCIPTSRPSSLLQALSSVLGPGLCGPREHNRVSPGTNLSRGSWKSCSHSGSHFPSTRTRSGTIKPVVFEQLFYSFFSPLGVHSLSKSLSYIWMKRIPTEFSSLHPACTRGSDLETCGSFFQLFQRDLDCAFSNRVFFWWT